MTLQEIATSLESQNRWDSNYITYSFKSSRLPYELDQDFDGSTQIRESMKKAVGEIFDYISTVTNLHFVYTDDIGEIVFSSKQMSDPGTLGYTYQPRGDTVNSGGDVYINSSFSDADFQKGGIGYSTLIHEIGHALGLNHPFGEGSYPGVDINETVMSYNPYEGYDEFNSHHFDISTFTTYQSADLMALQQMYAPNDTLQDNFYDLNSMLFSKDIYGYTGWITDNVCTIDDKGGIDTLSLQDLPSSYHQYINLTPGSESVITDGEVHHYLTLTKDTLIENLKATYSSDTIILNSADNTIEALSGYDTVYDYTNYTPAIDKLSDTVVLKSPDGGFDILKDIERLYINDKEIDLDLYQRNTLRTEHIEEAKQLDRLYLAAFDRVADKDGILYWLNDLALSKDINSIANSFTHSDEFVSLYGKDITDKEYIDLLYHNVLSRDADSQGEEYWIKQMQNGLDKADLLLSFSNSDEFMHLTGVYFGNDFITVL